MALLAFATGIVVVVLGVAVRAAGQLPPGYRTDPYGGSGTVGMKRYIVLDRIEFNTSGLYAEITGLYHIWIGVEGGTTDRNCYTLLTNDVGGKYIVQLEFLHGNYDNLGSTSVRFNLMLGVNHWDIVNLDTDDDDYGYRAYTAVFVAWASWAPVCLINIGQGTPFVSTVELRPLENLPYPVMANQSLSLFERRSMRWSADNDIVRYPDDQYDRYWYAWDLKEDDQASNISTQSPISASQFAVPPRVLETAFVPAVGNSNELILRSKRAEILPRDHLVILHFAVFQNNKSRQFAASVDDGTQSSPISPGYLSGSSITIWSSDSAGFSVKLTATAMSDLSPILNAYEVYGLIIHDNPTTSPQDFDAIMAIKHEYGIKKNWMGDPCFPNNFASDGWCRMQQMSLMIKL
uniref:Malectin-like domain-containing protein n=1 Tax=Oryza brachyantha TaxID=4533 RepID=J3MWS4_ORYBR